jgi:endonuclease/exonuclease/phosphatase family metal-dependent hydrolase
VDVSGPVSFRLLAVWTRAEHRYVQSLAGDLDTLKASRSRRPVVLAGDFNSNSIWDRPLDYCFVPESWPIRGVSVGGEGAWAGLSDHRPVVVDLDV